MNDVERLLESKGRGGIKFHGFVNDEEVRVLARVQEREFLNNCTKPAVGQRVEVYFSIDNSFYLSGEVIEVKAPPLESIRPMEHCEDKSAGKGSMGVSGALVPRLSCSNLVLVDMSQLRYGRFCSGCRGVHMSRSTWEDEVPDEVKQETFEKMGHTQAVGLKHYDDSNMYNQAVPQNLLQGNMNPKQMNAIVVNQVVPPAFSNPSFFDQSKTPRTQDVDEPLEILRTYAKSKEDCEEQSSSPLVCCGSTCTETFLVEGDWRKHMKTCDSSSFVCPWCTSETRGLSKLTHNSYAKLSDHMRTCKNKPARFARKPKAVGTFVCECKSTFTTQKSLTAHKKNSCKLNEGRSDLRVKCEACGKAFSSKGNLKRHEEDSCAGKTDSAVDAAVAAKKSSGAKRKARGKSVSKEDSSSTTKKKRKRRAKKKDVEDESVAEEGRPDECEGVVAV